ncbi:MAG: hypothetical protein WBA44_18355 [Mesorhizobium sp.]
MFRQLIYATAIVGGLFSPALSQDDNRAMAEKYIRLPAMQIMLDTLLGPGFIDPLMTQMIGSNPISAEKRAELVKITTEELASIRSKMEAALIDSAAETYTAEELDALILFNSSPVAVSIMSKLQPFNSAYLGRIGSEMQAMQARMNERVLDVMRP